MPIRRRRSELREMETTLERMSAQAHEASQKEYAFHQQIRQLTHDLEREKGISAKATRQLEVHRSACASLSALVATLMDSGKP